MKNIKKILFWVGNFVFFMVAFSYLTMIPAQAYIDPSAVTYTIQAVAGVVIALGALATIFRHKIAALFKKNKDTEKKEVHFTDDEAESTTAESTEDTENTTAEATEVTENEAE